MLCGPETAYHHEATAGHLRCLGASETEFLWGDDVPETEDFPESEQLEGRSLIADLATHLDIRRATSETLWLGVGLEDSDELIFVLLRLDLVHAHDDEVEIHLLNTCLLYTSPSPRD